MMTNGDEMMEPIRTDLAGGKYYPLIPGLLDVRVPPRTETVPKCTDFYDMTLLNPCVGCWTESCPHCQDECEAYTIVLEGSCDFCGKAGTKRNPLFDSILEGVAHRGCFEMMKMHVGA